MRELTDTPSGGLGWLDAAGPEAEIVLSTRIRLARNLQGYGFSARAGAVDRQAVYERVRQAADEIPQLRGGVLVPIPALRQRARQLLLERHLVSRELVGGAENTPPPFAALLLGTPESLGVMVNEEDHLRLQSLLSGLRLHEAWELIDGLDSALAERLPYAFHPEFGFLTSCPTNVGTGLRASVLVHLPGLVLTQEIGKVLQAIAQVGLTFRGLHGEGSEVVGNFFQISNQTTLGQAEDELIDHLQKMVQQVIQYERRARGVLLRDAPEVIKDKVWRAYGLLRYARALSLDEVMNLSSGLRLGISLKLLPGPSVLTLNQILVFSQLAHLEQMTGRALAAPEVDAVRADYVRRLLEADAAPASGAADPEP